VKLNEFELGEGSGIELKIDKCSYEEDEGPLQIFRIKGTKFLKICEEFPSSKMVMENKAKERRRKFRKV
jgi:hypothetical protein